ncbi:MAG: UDP-N-acetylmuramate--L-alanine ligase, partial [bacterium]|nr:UDP-N-acetylmuramate--L-alanine ligase [bacterium]
KYQIRDTKYQIPILSYPEALGELTKKYFTIAVSGSHGKSTTTAMIANILIKAGLDPTVIIGTKLKEFGNPTLSLSNGSNFRPGKSEYLIIEADEWNASFLNYWPKMIVLTNIDKEHLDYYKNLNHIVRTFREYVGHLPKEGTLVANGDDKNTQEMLNRRLKIQDSRLKVSYYGKKLKSEILKLKSILKVPGEHNVYNALAALSAARALNIPDKISFKALSEYRGAWRRFEVIGKFKGATVISDYAHHPTEIKATLAAARQKYPGKEIWCVFQPHQMQRTKYLFKDFTGAFDDADKIFLLDIYGVAGREKSANWRRNGDVSSGKLARAIKKRGKDINYFRDFNATVGALKPDTDRNKVILVMGAGDIWKIGKHLTSNN